jgi:hypothetical protein
MENEIIYYPKIERTITPKSLDESNKLITGLIEKIKKYENEHGRSISADYTTYQQISSDPADKLGKVILDAKFYSSNFVDSIRRFKAFHLQMPVSYNYDPSNVVYGKIDTNFVEVTPDKSSDEITRIKISVSYEPCSSAENFRKEYQGLAKIINEIEI